MSDTWKRQIVVCGSALAGLSAAVTVAGTGAEVHVLERGPR